MNEPTPRTDYTKPIVDTVLESMQTSRKIHGDRFHCSSWEFQELLDGWKLAKSDIERLERRLRRAVRWAWRNRAQVSLLKQNIHDLAANSIFRGNSVEYIYCKMRVYSDIIDHVNATLMDVGMHFNGELSNTDLIRALASERDTLKSQLADPDRHVLMVTEAYNDAKAERDALKSMGVCELAAVLNNASLNEYMTHWEKRAEKAEADNARLRKCVEAADEIRDHGPVNKERWAKFDAARRAIDGKGEGEGV